MSYFDFSLLAIIGVFTLFGLWFGFVHTLGSLVGTVFGVFLASRFYEPMGNWLVSITGWQANTAKVFMFVLSFIIINRLVGFAFWIVDKIASIITRLPFISSINHILGAVLGFFEGFITIGLIIYFIERFPLSEKIMQHIAESTVAPYTTKMASVLVPLMPEALRLLQSSVDYVKNIVL